MGRVVLDKLARFKSNPSREKGGNRYVEGKRERETARGTLYELFCISGSRSCAQHLRCKILNPGASAISPTSSKEEDEPKRWWMETVRTSTGVRA